jgi:hypothetical protein
MGGGLRRMNVTCNQGSDPRIATYVNNFKVGHNLTEFVIDFSQAYSGEGEALCLQRLVLSPQRAKELMQLLQESIADFQHDYGDIRGIGGVGYKSDSTGDGA